MSPKIYRDSAAFTNEELLDTLDFCRRNLPPGVDPIHFDRLGEIERRLYHLLVCV